MKITIKGSPEELAELMKALQDGAGNEDKLKKPYSAPILEELGEGEKLTELAEVIQTASKENAPQVEAAEQKRTFAHFKPRFEMWAQLIREANEDS